MFNNLIYIPNIFIQDQILSIFWITITIGAIILISVILISITIGAIVLLSQPLKQIIKRDYIKKKDYK